MGWWEEDLRRLQVLELEWLGALCRLRGGGLNLLYPQRRTQRTEKLQDSLMKALAARVP